MLFWREELQGILRIKLCQRGHVFMTIGSRGEHMKRRCDRPSPKNLQYSPSFHREDPFARVQYYSAGQILPELQQCRSSHRLITVKMPTRNSIVHLAAVLIYKPGCNLRWSGR